MGGGDRARNGASPAQWVWLDRIVAGHEPDHHHGASLQALAEEAEGGLAESEARPRRNDDRKPAIVTTPKRKRAKLARLRGFACLQRYFRADGGR
jgi:hypothetical protein